ncbi:hypothetical protein E8F11_23310 [Pseudomonas sp. BN417]|nr:hypothetical protein [Pseudomonas sp. BN417]
MGRGTQAPPAGTRGRGVKRWPLLGADGLPCSSLRPGTLGGHRRSRIYGRLDCPAALRAIARGGYVKERVFFLDETTAQAAGYRPCAKCMREGYLQWKAQQQRNPPGPQTASAQASSRQGAPSSASMRAQSFSRRTSANSATASG